MTPEEFAKFALDRRRMAVLGLLAVEPVDTDGLVAATGQDRREVLEALGVLAVEGLVTKGDAGAWVLQESGLLAVAEAAKPGGVDAYLEAVVGVLNPHLGGLRRAFGLYASKRHRISHLEFIRLLKDLGLLTGSAKHVDASRQYPSVEFDLMCQKLLRSLSLQGATLAATGEEFDRSDGPFRFNLGYGEVIKGWEEGVIGMRCDETRRLTIPPKLAYGKRGSPPEIPPDATLVFEVTMLRFEPVG